MTAELPTLYELRKRYPDSFSVAAGKSEASGWAFVLGARSRGWIVSEPNSNGFGYWFVTVWEKGPEDAGAEGRFRPETSTEREERERIEAEERAARGWVG